MITYGFRHDHRRLPMVSGTVMSFHRFVSNHSGRNGMVHSSLFVAVSSYHGARHAAIHRATVRSVSF